MEPMHPDLRAALKAAHPGLTDEQIDLQEDLLAQRFQLDPETQEPEIRALDRRREELIQQHMPKFEQVTQMFRQRKTPDGGREGRFKRSPQINQSSRR